MKKFLSLFAIAATALIFLTTGCKEDETPIIDLPPDVVFLTEDPNDGSLYFFEDFEVTDTASSVAIGIDVTKGTGTLKSLTITQDGSNVSFDRLDITDLRTATAVVANNPLLITGDNIDGLQFEILLNVQDVYESATYVFTVTDENNLSGSASITITAVKPDTPLEMTIDGVLFNSAGPAGTGGLDLDNGASTGSANSAAEIRDLGIDCADPAASNWLQQFGTINGADMRKVDPTAIEGFAFADVATKEIILQAYDTGIILADGSTVNTTGCDAVPLSVTDVAAPQEGDVYVVESGGRYYMIEVAAINVITTGNGDNYEINIKY